MHKLAYVLSDSLFFGMAISLIAYGIGMVVNKKVKLAIANPMLVSVLIIIAFLKLTGLNYSQYMNSAKYLSYLLTPATICLAVPLYEKLQLLKENLVAIILGILSGIIANVLCIWLVCIIFTLDNTMFATMLPKSITTAIGMAVSEEIGGVVNITIALIVVTGITGFVVADAICKIFKITDPVAKGVAIGNASHVLGTSKAVSMGETEGAMSGLAVAVAGILTVITAPLVLSMFE